MKKHKTIKKVFAILMALSVIFSYSVVAMADVEPESQQPTSQQQIGKYFEVYDSNGSTTGNSLDEGETQNSYANGQVLVNKTIAPRTSGEENLFDITLSVETRSKIEDIKISEDAAVVLVIDVSTSMIQDSFGAPRDRLDKAKKAAEDFVKSFQSTKDGVKRKVAIVCFSGWKKQDIDGAKVVKGWADATDSSVITAINNLNANGGTNMAAGIKLASNLLTDSKSLQGIDNKNIILLTDGNPTFGMKDGEAKSTSKTVICEDGKNMIGGGSYTSHDVHKQVEEISKSTALADVSKYAVYIGGDSIVCQKSVKKESEKNGDEPKYELVADCGLNENVATWLTSCGFDAKSVDANDLDKVFKEISRKIEINAQAWLVTDPMGQNIEFKSGLTETPNSNGLSFKNNTLYWDLKLNHNPELIYEEADSADSIDPDNKKVIGFRYSYTYTVKLDTLADKYSAGTFYPTNGKTDLTYVITRSDDPTDAIPVIHRAYFNIPTVKGYDANLSFTKVNEAGSILPGATFKLESVDKNLSGDKYQATETSKSDGSVSFKNIPSGHEYTLTEVTAPENYQVAEPRNVKVEFGMIPDAYNVTSITDKPETKNITITKEWNDNNNQDGKRPSEITVTLTGTTADNETVTQTAEISGALTENIWSNTVAVPKVYAGKLLTYTVEESSIVGYECTEASGDESNGFVFKNTHTPEKTSVSGSKTWNDSNNQDNKRPSSITVYLHANGTKVDEKVVTAADGWSWTFENVDKYAGGSEITYSVTEEAVPGYTPDLKGMNITNSYTPDKTSVTVTKEWDDDNNRDGIRPSSVTVQLFANEEAVEGKTVELSASNNWIYTFSDLDKYAGGQLINYSVVELPVAGYICTKTGEGTRNITIKNTHVPATTSITVKKEWIDGNNKDGIRPSSVTIRLSNGDSAELSDANSWTHTFTNLYVNSEGKPIEYTVSEDSVDGYTTEISGNGSSNVTVKNSHTPEEEPPVIPVIPPFTPESVYTVTYMDGVDDEVVFDDQSTTNLKLGEKTPAFVGEPTREGYKFIGWSPEVSETVKGDAVYYAQWEKLPEEPSVVDPSGDNDPIDDGKDIDAQPNGDADADVEAKGVKTGDETMLALWGALGLIAALGLGGTLVIGRRREE